MSVIYDNWERLVRATLRREQLRISALRTPSDLSSASASPSPSFNFSSQTRRISSFNFWSLLAGDSFTYHQILKATDFLSDSNLIKHGHSGDLYKGVLESNQVVVKKINLSSIDRELEFRSELEICGMVYHSRLVPFLGHCMENVHEKFLVYKYTPNKDLSSHLQREVATNAEGNHGQPLLDWITRLKIAVGAAEGLCYLHHERFPPLVHRDIQASSILLDDDFEVRLGSLTEVCIQEKDNKQKSIAGFLRLPKVFEQSSSGTPNASCAYDVYCFGKILLELVSGKPGISSVNDYTMKDWMANTLRYVVPDDKKLVVNIVDPCLIIDEHLLMEVWAVAFVAKACLSPKLSKRPRMTEVLKALQDTKSKRFTGGNLQPAGHPSSVVSASTMKKVSDGSQLIGVEHISAETTNTTTSGSSNSSGNHVFSEAYGNEKVYTNGVILDNSNLRIFTYLELKAATRGFSIQTLLGEDASGRVYKGSLQEKSMSNSGNRSLIAVKEMYSRGVEGCESELRLLGRLSHPNVVKLLGYCREDERIFHVYEFLQEGSLDEHLFLRGSTLQPLSWNLRLKILIGAARGLAFLHASERRGFFSMKREKEGFYVYFKPSNILLDGDFNAKISGFSVTGIDNPDLDSEAHPIIYTSGRYVYAAPECFSVGDLCLESDVYGFGVLLVRMLTGIDEYHSRSFEELGVLKFIEKNMDIRLDGNYPSKAAVKMAWLAKRCLQRQLRDRPSMKEVVKILESMH